ncbi:hypothetical protein C8R46DRAFT_1273365 [Mycena filopes]|nr:hypothetical protein C8R46DRAFT_1273365 [Mycena filopes]
MLFLDQDRACMTNLDTQIFELERSLSKLRAAREVVQARLDAFKYPVLTLPNEVVGEIFTQFVPTYPLRPPLVGPESPTLLTHICHLWREIAAYICSVWLKRSLSAPLSMRIGDWELSQTIAELLPMVILHRARWEYLEVNLTSYELTAIEGPLPFLRQLNLTVEEDSDDADVDPVALLDVPLLRNVTLDDNTIRRIRLPWAQITSLTLNRVYREDCAPLLAQTRNLVHCRLLLFNDPNPGPTLHVSLPHLQTLVMTQEGANPVLEYLDTFVAPALLTLQVPESFLGPEPIEYLRLFICTSDCKLRDVVITGGKIESIDSYRSAFPSIDRFSLRRYKDPDRGFGEISVD